MFKGILLISVIGTPFYGFSKTFDCSLELLETINVRQRFLKSDDNKVLKDSIFNPQFLSEKLGYTRQGTGSMNIASEHYEYLYKYQPTFFKISSNCMYEQNCLYRTIKSQDQTVDKLMLMSLSMYESSGKIVTCFQGGHQMGSTFSVSCSSIPLSENEIEQSYSFIATPITPIFKEVIMSLQRGTYFELKCKSTITAE